MLDGRTELPAGVIIFFIFIAGELAVTDSSLESDKQVLLRLQSFIEKGNPVTQGVVSQWNQTEQSSPCHWPGVLCDGNPARVTGISLPGNGISGGLFDGFSALSELRFLDLSGNRIEGTIPGDLRLCRNLRGLNLSHNIISGELNLTGLVSLEVLDLSENRFDGRFPPSLTPVCGNLVVVNVSSNRLIGEVAGSLDECWNLKYLDLGDNNFTGDLRFRFDRLIEFSISHNNFTGELSPWIFPSNCSLETLDMSENHFVGTVPPEISNCRNLVMLDLWGNNFMERIPAEIGSLQNLKAIFLGNNNFSRDIPKSLLGLRNLSYLEMSGNHFGGDIQEIFGEFTEVRFLILRSNSFTGGINSSGILNLKNLYRLDLSYNSFTGRLPVEISQMNNLMFLMMASNHFTGSIPPQYGNLSRLQALDLSNNSLNGSIPPSLGNLRSLLWLMLANNSLTGEIPPELGNCSSLLWLNLANNRIEGKLSPGLTSMGRNPTRTFLINREANEMSAGTGECSAMKRWIPADYAPFSFVYTLLTRKNCRILWNRLLQGYGLFPGCVAGSNNRTLQISGYLQLHGNKLSGEVPSEIGNMRNLSILHLGYNQLSGKLPREIELMPLTVLNLTRNNFSGEIPPEIGNLKCLRNLDLSYNNFSGLFPSSLVNLHDLSKFNISYNKYISGKLPETGQLVTFETAYFGNPLLQLPFYIGNNANQQHNRPPTQENKNNNPANRIKASRRKNPVIWAFVSLVLTFFLCGIMILIFNAMNKSQVDETRSLFDDMNPDTSSEWWSNIVEVIRLDKTGFTYADILKATKNFSVDNIIGVGGSGTVYHGVLRDGREVAVKKLQREGREGEREFLAEMEVLRGNNFGWPHPNLVTLYGWCLSGSDKLLVYEYMEGGTLDDLIEDQTRLPWRRRIDVAIDVACALVFLHHECFPGIVHRDVKASNVLIDRKGKARVTDFGLARVVDAGSSHVSTMVAGTVGYVPPEYGQRWQATTKGDVYSFGVLAMELATGKRAVEAGQEFLVEKVRQAVGNARQGLRQAVVPMEMLVSGDGEGANQMWELLQVGMRCIAESPKARPNMKEVLAVLIMISSRQKHFHCSSSTPPSP